MQTPLTELTTRLTEHKLTLVTAESCTGGGLSYLLTSLPGSSAWFERGFVTYSNESKIELLGVPSNTIQTYGAVSEETAHAMAAGALKASRADIAIAITGIAGPEGGCADKPVGMVCFGIACTKQPTKTETQLFTGNRDIVRQLAIEHAIMLITEIVS